MRNKTSFWVKGAVIAALYVVLTHLQNMIFPDSTTMAIQFRLSEALCVLAFFTPATIPGLTVGCLLFNLTSGQALPLDFLVGSLATLGASGSMWLLRRATVKGYPLPGMLMPALWNGLLVGWELSQYVGGGFWLNALLVFVGEATVLLVAGSVFLGIIRTRKDHLKL